MTANNFDFLGQGDWRKRIYQLKQELRSSASKPSLAIPEQTKPYGNKQTYQTTPRRAIKTP